VAILDSSFVRCRAAKCRRYEFEVGMPPELAATTAEEWRCLAQLDILASETHAQLIYDGDEAAQKAARTGQSVVSYVRSYEEPPLRAAVIFVPRRQKLDSVLLSSAIMTVRRQKQRPRERRQRRTSRSASSRGDPPEPDLAVTAPGQAC
jgi:hypothetical protein